MSIVELDTSRADPGKTLAIVGLVLAFVFPLAGLAVTLVSREKTRRAGYLPSDIARAALIVNVVTVMPLTLFVGGWLGGLLGTFVR